MDCAWDESMVTERMIIAKHTIVITSVSARDRACFKKSFLGVAALWVLSRHPSLFKGAF